MSVMILVGLFKGTLGGCQLQEDSRCPFLDCSISVAGTCSLAAHVAGTCRRVAHTAVAMPSRARAHI